MARRSPVDPSHPLFCTKCEGTGYVAYYANYSNGVCFDCNGTGKMREGSRSRAQEVDTTPREDWREGKKRKQVQLLGVSWLIYERRPGEYRIIPVSLDDEYGDNGFEVTVRGGRVVVDVGTTGTTLDALGLDHDHPTQWPNYVKRLQAELQARFRP